MSLNLAETIQKCKDRIKPIENDLILVFVIVFVGFIAFGLGRLSAVSERKTPIKIENMTASLKEAKTVGGDSISQSSAEKMFVASKSGTKYHYPWCPGAQSIKEENKVWFPSEQEAKKAGYTPAGNCKGLPAGQAGLSTE